MGDGIACGQGAELNQPPPPAVRAMDALMKEIERKRKAHAAVRPASGGKKYFRRGGTCAPDPL